MGAFDNFVLRMIVRGHAIPRIRETVDSEIAVKFHHGMVRLHGGGAVHLNLIVVLSPQTQATRQPCSRQEHKAPGRPLCELFIRLSG